MAHPSNRGEYEISEALDLLIQCGRTIDAIGIDGWRVDVGYPEDWERAEALLRGEEPVAVEEETVEPVDCSPVLK